MTDEPTPDDIDELIDAINDGFPWTVEDWTHETGMFDEPTVTVTLQWNPLSALNDGEIGGIVTELRETIDEKSDGKMGADIDTVVKSVADTISNADERDVRSALSNLKQRGEVYQPTADTLRTT